MTLFIHIAAGVLGLIFGAVALAAAKGKTLHRGSGKYFVYSMVAMSLTGVVISFLRDIGANAVGGLVAFYFVITALTTVRPASDTVRRLDRGMMWLGFAVGSASFFVGLLGIANGKNQVDTVPVPMFLIFGAITSSAAVSDWRILQAGGITGVPRLRRHLWRMCFAMFIATGSFFLGQPKVIPASLRVFPVLVLLALLPLLSLAYWLWQYRTRRSKHAAVAGMYEGVMK